MWYCNSACIAIAVPDSTFIAGSSIILYKVNPNSTEPDSLRGLFLVIGGCLLSVASYTKPIRSVFLLLYCILCLGLALSP
jgi:hypothetical protein